MKTSFPWVLCLALMPAVMWVGCSEQNKRLNAPPQGQSSVQSELSEYYSVMVDNAALYDMCVADIHFVPHTARINSLGEYRLGAYCELLQEDGGTIHLDTDSTDEALNASRMRSVSDYLAAGGLDMAAVRVEVGMPQGRPIDAADAIRIKQAGTTMQEDDASASSGATSGGV